MLNELDYQLNGEIEDELFESHISNNTIIDDKPTIEVNEVLDGSVISDSKYAAHEISKSENNETYTIIDSTPVKIPDKIDDSDLLEIKLGSNAHPSFKGGSHWDSIQAEKYYDDFEKHTKQVAEDIAKGKFEDAKMHQNWADEAKSKWKMYQDRID